MSTLSMCVCESSRKIREYSRKLRLCEALRVGRVEIRRRLIQCEDAAVDAKRLSERQPDDEAGKDLGKRKKRMNF